MSAVIGGALIGLAATLLMLLNGRVAGISGILATSLIEGRGGREGSAAFMIGLIPAPLTAYMVGYPVLEPEMPQSWTTVIAGGMLVGSGTRLGRRSVAE